MLYLINYNQEGCREDCVDEDMEFPLFIESRLIEAPSEAEARKAFMAQFIAVYSPIRIMGVTRMG